MKQSRSGFTIVELLIVIVIVGILAAITIVAYNGITVRVKNTKTISAVENYVRAIKLYKADSDTWPSTNSCMGSTTTYPGSYACASLYTGWTVNATFATALKPYFGNTSAPPEPDITEISFSSTDRYRGAYYIADVNSPYILFVQIGTNTCPPIVGLVYYQTDVTSEGVYCRARL